MRKFLFIFFFLLFLILVFQSRNASVYSAVCGASSQFDCCGLSCPNGYFCDGAPLYGCGCAPGSAATATPRPAAFSL